MGRATRSHPSFAQLFTPKLVTVWREGYGLSDLRADALAGLTVAIVALPLSMAIAVACGLTPDRGLYTAVVGGFLISLLGGSRFQIGGPAGAFIVLIASIVQRHGYDGLALATILAGLILLAIGFLQLGTYIKYIPYPVTVGFTAGIAVIILASQIKELLGLNLAQEPAELVPKLIAIAAAITTAKFLTVAIAVLSLVIMIGVHSLRPAWPAFLIAIVWAAALCAWFNLDVATVGSRFGGVPNMLPLPSAPEFSFEKIRAVLPDAIAIALLGAIESLLSAVVADGMTGRRHRSNCELVAQGAANIGTAVFGGFCVTGTIARTATNVRAGARGPMSGIFHSLYLLLFMLIAAPLVSFIPLASLAAVLVIVAVNMADRREFWSLMRTSRGDALVLLATFFLTIAYDLATAIGVGVVLGSFLFLHRMEQAVEIEAGTSVKLVTDDQSDTVSARTRYDASAATNRDVVVFRISGAFFFGATARINGLLDRIGEHPRAFILDFGDVPMIDTTAAKMLRGFVQNMRRSRTIVYFTGTRRSVRRALLTSGPKRTEVRYMESIESAKQAATNAQHLNHKS